MLIVISPAKTLDFDTPPPTLQHSQPDFLKDSQQLVEQLRELSPPQLAELMGISHKLADLNFGRYLDWKRPFTKKNAKQALLAFKGDVYTGLQAEDLSLEDLGWAQQHLRILSGLYGVLRPLDLMQPYRLEMGTALGNGRGKDLYAFWGERVTKALNKALQGQPVLINLASNEYFKAVRPEALDAEIITPVFKDWKSGKYKIISFFAKKARGMMTRYIIQNRIEDPEAIKGFDMAGYQYNSAMSEGNQWVFVRDEQSV